MNAGLVIVTVNDEEVMECLSDVGCIFDFPFGIPTVDGNQPNGGGEKFPKPADGGGLGPSITPPLYYFFRMPPFWPFPLFPTQPPIPGTGLGYGDDGGERNTYSGYGGGGSDGECGILDLWTYDDFYYGGAFLGGEFLGHGTYTDFNFTTTFAGGGVSWCGEVDYERAHECYPGSTILEILENSYPLGISPTFPMKYLGISFTPKGYACVSFGGSISLPVVNYTLPIVNN